MRDPGAAGHEPAPRVEPAVDLGACPPELRSKHERLVEILGSLDRVMVAFSGGVDSSFLLRVAHEVLGSRVVALTTVSPTNPEDDTATAIALARALGVEHVVIEADELEIPSYAANPVNRCYFCKNALYEICTAHAGPRGITTIVDGVNADDLGDYRPGLRAADEHRTRHPLVEAEMTKADVRALSRVLGLPTWDKPASPCLSSRFPYGTEITHERLQMVARAETALRDLGFCEVRVRYHGDIARIEVPAGELARFADPEVRRAATAGVRAAGFRWVTLDLDGFRSGSLNDQITSGRGR
jgi:uncharacterized protein